MSLVAAEWIKMRSLRSTPWTFALTALFVVGSAAMAAWGDYTNFPNYPPEMQREHPFALADAFPSTGYQVLMLVAGCVGALAIVSEYSTGLIRSTTVAVPARDAVLLAKAVVVAAVWAVLGVVLTTASFVVSQTILSGRDAAVSITDGVTVRAWVATALLAPVCALVGLGLGVVIRHAAATMVVTVVTLLMLPAFFSTTRRWTAEINHLMVSTAWNRLTMPWTPTSGNGYWAATVTESWIVYAIWPLFAVALATVVIRRRDV